MTTSASRAPPVDSELASTPLPLPRGCSVLVTGRVGAVLGRVSPLSASTAPARSRAHCRPPPGVTAEARDVGRRHSELPPVPGSRDCDGAGGPLGGHRPRPHAEKLRSIAGRSTTGPPSDLVLVGASSVQDISMHIASHLRLFSLAAHTAQAFLVRDYLD